MLPDRTMTFVSSAYIETSTLLSFAVDISNLTKQCKSYQVALGDSYLGRRSAGLRISVNNCDGHIVDVFVCFMCRLSKNFCPCKFLCQFRYPCFIKGSLCLKTFARLLLSQGQFGL
jgi:hypothetical protein